MTACGLFLGLTFGLLAEEKPSAPYGVGVWFGTDQMHPQAKRCEHYLEIWYPSPDRRSVPNDPAEDYCKDAVRDGSPAPGRFPVVLFSHGLGGFRGQSVFLCEFLAKRGYIVVAPDHRGSCAYDLAPLDLWGSVKARAGDLRATLSAIERWNGDRRDFLHGRFDLEKIAVMGHSLGGTAALAFGGAWVKDRGLPHWPDDPPVADYLDLSEPRIRAVVALAPLRWPFLDPIGLGRVKAPLLVMTGTRDLHTPSLWQSAPVFDAAMGPKHLALLEGATHFHFVDEEFLRNAPWFVRKLHYPKIDRATANRCIEQTIVRFLDEQLAQKCSKFDVSDLSPALMLRSAPARSGAAATAPVYPGRSPKKRRSR
jgi:predicted dienelactone hydrolase